ncbi:MAG: porin [Gallionella sp.]
MQKKLIALAIASVISAPAFADTQVYGLIDAGFGSVTNTPTAAGGASGTKTGESGIAFSQNQTSKVGVKSTEDLSNGMKASYILEMGLSSNPASDAQFGKTSIGATHNGFTPNATIGPDRILAVDLNLGEGTDLIAGKVSSPLRGIVYGNDAMYGANLVGNLVTMDGSLTARAVAAAAVHNFGAVTASLAFLDDTVTTDGAADQKYGNGYEATAVYNQDALSVSAGYRDLKLATNGAPGTDIDNKVTILAANYNFGVAKVYGQYATVQQDDAIAATTDKKTYETFGVNMPFTPVFAGYVELGTGKHDTGTDSPKLSAYAVGVKYDMSKATWAYAHVGSAKQDNTALVAGSKVDQYAFGLVHSF